MLFSIAATFVAQIKIRLSENTVGRSVFGKYVYQFLPELH